ncbi:VOC family protein [Nocardia sp. NPDC046473]|uniref:VOC family protein n=1 Tax=Nocardia sp. NPDC046473 TaxID=3155733 RepID=UPI0033C7E0EB
MITRIDHVGIACFDLDETIRLYKELYGFSVCHREINDSQGVDEAMLRINGTDDGKASYVQLLAATRPDSPIAKFLDKRGEGIHHIAFGCDDVEFEAQAMAGRGVTVWPFPQPASMGSRATFVHPKSSGGVLVELVTSKQEG